jgi:hypothetical protein
VNFCPSRRFKKNTKKDAQRTKSRPTDNKFRKIVLLIAEKTTFGCVKVNPRIWPRVGLRAYLKAFLTVYGSFFSYTLSTVPTARLFQLGQAKQFLHRISPSKVVDTASATRNRRSGSG